MDAVVTLKQADKLVEVYKQAYEQRYGSKPVLENPIELQLFLKNLVGKFGEEKVASLLRFYIASDGHLGWWRNKGHSVKVFKDDIEAINAGYSSTNRQAMSKNNGYDSMIVFESQCPKCKGWHNIACRGSEAEKHAYTTHCKSCTELA